MTLLIDPIAQEPKPLGNRPPREGEDDEEAAKHGECAGRRRAQRVDDREDGEASQQRRDPEVDQKEGRPHAAVAPIHEGRHPDELDCSSAAAIRGAVGMAAHARMKLPIRELRAVTFLAFFLPSWVPH
ncbi:MAG: hypothetical protein IT428_04550 [Planctomycetaceae bacterium]|nr:hypothetical protein [Planctomycetaceae bacterium]